MADKRTGSRELFDFLDEPEPEYDWLIPDLLERGDRVIVTGQEGHGKSTFLRQLCLQVAAGVHPFTLDQMPSYRTLLVDLENPERHLRRKIRELAYLAPITKGDVLVLPKPEGLDLTDSTDRQRLELTVAMHEPALLCIGPTYKMASGDPKDEEQARTVSQALDHIRVQYSCTLIIETHQPYAAQGASRPERPYGASLWSRWPEYGIYLSPHGDLSHWRGQRDERQWPKKLVRGAPWPWMVETPWQPNDDTPPAPWEGYTDRQAAILAVLDQNPTQWHSEAQILKVVAGVPQVTRAAVKQLVVANRVEWATGPAGKGIVYRAKAATPPP